MPFGGLIAFLIVYAVSKNVVAGLIAAFVVIALRHRRRQLPPR